MAAQPSTSRCHDHRTIIAASGKLDLLRKQAVERYLAQVCGSIREK